jgi:hypothetical protein
MCTLVELDKWWLSKDMEGNSSGLFKALFRRHYYYLIELQMGFIRWQLHYSKTQHTSHKTLKQNTAHKATETEENKDKPVYVWKLTFWNREDISEIL